MHDEHALLDAVEAKRLLCSFGDDPLVRFAVDHDLPLARTHRLAAILQGRQAFLLRLGAVVTHAFGVGLPDRQAPLLEQMHGVIDVAAHIVGQVVTGDAHQVVGDHARVVGRILLVADVGVDRGQTLRHGAGAVHGGLVDQLDLEFLAGLGLEGFGPAHHFICRAAAGHAAADQQNVQFFVDDFRCFKCSSHFVFLDWSIICGSVRRGCRRGSHP
jgi:hypothetical protein